MMWRRKWICIFGGRWKGEEWTLTFMPASSPVDKGMANAGPFPPEETVASASVRRPSFLMTNDWRAPSVFSFVALFEGEVREERRSVSKKQCSLEDALVGWVKRDPRWIGACGRLADNRKRSCVRVEEIGYNGRRVASSEDGEVDHISLLVVAEAAWKK